MGGSAGWDYVGPCERTAPQFVAIVAESFARAPKEAANASFSGGFHV
jgi:hypothetical protein